MKEEKLYTQEELELNGYVYLVLGLLAGIGFFLLIISLIQLQGGIS